VIIDLENIGAEVFLMRVDADVTQSPAELLALAEEELHTMVTSVGIAFAFPGTTANTVVDLTPGRYLAACFLPENADPRSSSSCKDPNHPNPRAPTSGHRTSPWACSTSHRAMNNAGRVAVRELAHTPFHPREPPGSPLCESCNTS
jgi:hypothetical protein